MINDRMVVTLTTDLVRRPYKAMIDDFWRQNRVLSRLRYIGRDEEYLDPRALEWLV